MSSSPTAVPNAGARGRVIPTGLPTRGRASSTKRSGFADSWRFPNEIRDEVCRHLRIDDNGKVWARIDYVDAGTFSTGRPKLRAIFSQSPRRGAEHEPQCWHDAMLLKSRRTGKDYHVVGMQCHPC